MTTPAEKGAMALELLATIAESGYIRDNEPSDAVAHLAARIAELEGERDKAHRICKEVAGLLLDQAARTDMERGRADRAEAELAAVRANAERYVWLRDHRDEDGFVDPELHVSVDSPKFPNKWALVGEDLDAAIDAARGAG